MAYNLEPIVFSDDEAENQVPVKVKGIDYMLKEASGKAAVAWRNAKSDALTIKDGKPVGVKNMSSTDPLLVSLCLFGLEDQPVPLETILSWPDRVQKTLFQRVLEISDLSEGGDTVEDLRAQRDKLDEQIEKIEELVKNQTDPSTDGTD